MNKLFGSRVMGLVLIVALVSAFGPATIASAQSPTAVVVYDQAPVHSWSSEGTPVIATLVRGQVVSLTGWRSFDAHWVEVFLDNGSRGWVEAFYLDSDYYFINLKSYEPDAPSVPAESIVNHPYAAIVNGVRLNMRRGPGEANAVVDVIPSGQYVVMLGRSNDGFWVQVRLASGTVGWVYGGYLKSEAPVASLPIIADSNPDPSEWTPGVSAADGQGGFTPTYGTGGPNTYMVQTGDTLFGIALRYGVDPATLAAHNNIADPNYIRIGQVLYIP